MSTVTASPTALDVSDEQVVIGEGVALDVRPAGFVLRVASGVIDVIALLLVGLLSIYLFAIVATSPVGSRLFGDVAILVAAFTVLQVGILVVLPALVETFTHGKSLGRLVMGLRIVRDDGGASGLRQAFIRSVTGMLEIFMTAGGLAMIIGLFNARSKRLGDILAGTYAQNERAPKVVAANVALPPGLEQWASIADVARLPDPTSRRVRDYLVQAPKLGPLERDRAAGAVAREVARYVHPIPDVDADRFLRAVAVVRRDREFRGLQLGAARHERLRPVLEAMPFGFPDRG